LPPDTFDSVVLLPMIARAKLTPMAIWGNGVKDRARQRYIKKTTGLRSINWAEKQSMFGMIIFPEKRSLERR
jgi:hypothetical protein